MNEESVSTPGDQPRLVAPADSLHLATPSTSSDALALGGSPTPRQTGVPAQREFLWKVHSYTNDYIRFADAKAGFSVGIASALLAVLYAAKCHELFVTLAPVQRTPLAWVSVGAFLSLVASILAAVAAVRPRLWTHSDKGFIFWRGIAEYDGPEMFTAAFQAQQ